MSDQQGRTVEITGNAGNGTTEMPARRYTVITTAAGQPPRVVINSAAPRRASVEDFDNG